MTIRNPEQGVIGGVVYGVFAGIERGVKLALKRPRPFDRFPHSVTMLQPSHPDDPSFPSGDCLRAWFLVLVIGFGFGGHTALLISLFFLACLVSLGRIALGVHFPLDTLAGTGLGISAGSVSLLLWSLVAGY
jgi:undecaprenyl-diphosphatase